MSEFVRSLERGLAVIRAFGPDDPELTLSDVARRTGLTRAAARRFLITLVEVALFTIGLLVWRMSRAAAEARST